MSLSVKTLRGLIETSLSDSINDLHIDYLIDKKSEDRFLKEILIDKIFNSNLKIYTKKEKLFFQNSAIEFVEWNYVQRELLFLYKSSNFLREKVLQKLQTYDETDKCEDSRLSEYVKTIISEYLEETIHKNKMTYYRISFLLKIKHILEFYSNNQSVKIKDYQLFCAKECALFDFSMQLHSHSDNCNSIEEAEILAINFYRENIAIYK